MGIFKQIGKSLDNMMGNSNNNPHGNRGHGHTHGPKVQNGYFGVISKPSLFFEGFIPNTNIKTKFICKTAEDAAAELQKNLTNEISNAQRFNKPMPPTSVYQNIAQQYPYHKVVEIIPKLY